MKKKTLCEKETILNNLNTISNNVMVNNFIENLLNHGSITNFFYDNKGNYTLKTKNKEEIHISIRKNHIYITSNIDNINQEFNYYINEDRSSFIEFKSSIIIDKFNHYEIMNILNKINYDHNGNLIEQTNTTESFLSSDNQETMKKLKQKQYENYTCIANDYLIDGKLIRKQTTNYIYQDETITTYFVSPYEKTPNFVPKFKPISEQEFQKYQPKISEKTIKKVKNVI